MTDPTGVATVYEFADARPGRVTPAAGTALEATTCYTSGPPTRSWRPPTPLGRTTSFDYDAAGDPRV